MPVVNYLKKVQLPNNTEYTVKDPTFFTGTTEEWNLLSTEEKQLYKIVNLTDDEEEGDISGKADKVTGAIDGNFAGLDGNGNLTDSGHKHSDYLTEHQDISGKADKVSSATNGNLAGLNGSGNPTDSGWNGDKTTQSATGNPISISGLKSNQLAINPIITLEPIQAGSGTPSPSNIRAISGYDKVEVESCGKNLTRGFIPQANYSPTITKSGNSYTISGYGGAFINVLLKSGKTYVLSFTLTSGTIGNLRFYDDLNATTNLFTITQGTAFTPSQDGYVRFWVDGTIVLTNIQLEEGSSATTYVHYNKATAISESLGQTVYGGTLDVRTGEFTVTKMLVDLGSLTWYRYSTTSIFHSTPTGQKVVSSVVCDSYNGVMTKIINLGNYEISANAEGFSTGNKIAIRNDSYTDATAFGNSLTGKYAVTELETPFTIQLTPHEISLLKDYAYVSTNGTSISLDYHNGELASLADVSQLGETVNELGDKVNVKFKIVTDTASSVGNFDPSISNDNVIVGVESLSAQYIGLPFKNDSGNWRCRFLDTTNIAYIKNTSITAKIYYI